MATPPAALPPQGPVSSARSQRTPHPPGRLSPSRALATAALLLLVGGPGGAQQPGTKEPALCPGDPHTGLHWAATERSCPAWGTWGRTRGAPASAPGPLLTKEDALLVGGASGRPWNCTPWRGAGEGRDYPSVCSPGATGAPLFAVSPCLSQLWVLRCRPLVGGWDARVRAPRPWALPGCGYGLYLRGSEGCPTRTTPVPSLARKDLLACSWHRSRS